MIDTHSSAVPLSACPTSRFGDPPIPFGSWYVFAIINASHILVLGTYLQSLMRHIFWFLYVFAIINASHIWNGNLCNRKQTKYLMHAGLHSRVGEGEVMQNVDSAGPQLQTKPIFNGVISVSKLPRSV